MGGGGKQKGNGRIWTIYRDGERLFNLIMGCLHCKMKQGPGKKDSDSDKKKKGGWVPPGQAKKHQHSSSDSDKKKKKEHHKGH